MTDDDRLDRIAAAVGRGSADRLNAIHACRDGHPFGRGDRWKWRNAASLVSRLCRSDDKDWLVRKAAEERAAMP